MEDAEIATQAAAIQQAQAQIQAQRVQEANARSQIQEQQVKLTSQKSLRSGGLQGLNQRRIATTQLGESQAQVEEFGKKLTGYETEVKQAQAKLSDISAQKQGYELAQKYFADGIDYKFIPTDSPKYDYARQYLKQMQENLAAKTDFEINMGKAIREYNSGDPTRLNKIPQIDYLKSSGFIKFEKVDNTSGTTTTSRNPSDNIFIPQVEPTTSSLADSYLDKINQPLFSLVSAKSPVSEVQPAPTFGQKYSESVKQGGYVKGTLNFLGTQLQEARTKSQQKNYKAGDTSAYYQDEPVNKLVGLAPQGAYFIPYVGATALVAGGIEDYGDLAINKQNSRISQTSAYLASQGYNPLISKGVYALPAAEIALGSFGLKGELSNLRATRELRLSERPNIINRVNTPEVVKLNTFNPIREARIDRAAIELRQSTGLDRVSLFFERGIKQPVQQGIAKVEQGITYLGKEARYYKNNFVGSPKNLNPQELATQRYIERTSQREGGILGYGSNRRQFSASVKRGVSSATRKVSGKIKYAKDNLWGTPKNLNQEEQLVERLTKREYGFLGKPSEPIFFKQKRAIKEAVEDVGDYFSGKAVYFKDKLVGSPKNLNAEEKMIKGLMDRPQGLLGYNPNAGQTRAAIKRGLVNAEDYLIGKGKYTRDIVVGRVKQLDSKFAISNTIEVARPLDYPWTVEINPKYGVLGNQMEIEGFNPIYNLKQFAYKVDSRFPTTTEYGILGKGRPILENQRKAINKVFTDLGNKASGRIDQIKFNAEVFSRALDSSKLYQRKMAKTYPNVIPFESYLKLRADSTPSRIEEPPLARQEALRRFREIKSAEVAPLKITQEPTIDKPVKKFTTAQEIWKSKGYSDDTRGYLEVADKQGRVQLMKPLLENPKLESKTMYLLKEEPPLARQEALRRFREKTKQVIEVLPPKQIILEKPQQVGKTESVFSGKGQYERTDQVLINTPKSARLTGLASVMPSQKPEIKEISVLKSLETSKEKEDSKVVLKVTPFFREATKQDSKLNQPQKENLKQPEALKDNLALNFKELQGQAQKQNYRQSQRYQQKQKEEQMQKPKPFLLPKPKTGLLQRLAKKAEAKDLFKVTTKRFGKDVNIGTFKTQKEAEIKLANVLRGTLARSGQIFQGDRALTIGETNLFKNKEFRSSKKSNQRIVQEAFASLGSSGERQEIKYFKGKKPIKNKKKFNFWG